MPWSQRGDGGCEGDKGVLDTRIAGYWNFCCFSVFQFFARMYIKAIQVSRAGPGPGPEGFMGWFSGPCQGAILRPFRGWFPGRFRPRFPSVRGSASWQSPFSRFSPCVGSLSPAGFSPGQARAGDSREIGRGVPQAGGAGAAVAPGGVVGAELDGSPSRSHRSQQPWRSMLTPMPMSSPSVPRYMAEIWMGVLGTRSLALGSVPVALKVNGVLSPKFRMGSSGAGLMFIRQVLVMRSISCEGFSESMTGAGVTTAVGIMGFLLLLALGSGFGRAAWAMGSRWWRSPPLGFPASW